jgi:hypothetical protein
MMHDQTIALGVLEGLLDVVNEVMVAFNSRCKAYQTIRDAQSPAFVQWLVEISHNTHLLHQGFATTQARSDVRNAKGIDKAAGGLKCLATPRITIPCDFEAKNSAESSREEARRDGVIDVRFQRGEVDPGNFWMRGEVTRQTLRVAIVSFHAQCQRLHAT